GRSRAESTDRHRLEVVQVSARSTIEPCCQLGGREGCCCRHAETSWRRVRVTLGNGHHLSGPVGIALLPEQLHLDEETAVRAYHRRARFGSVREGWIELHCSVGAPEPPSSAFDIGGNFGPLTRRDQVDVLRKSYIR